MKAKAFSIKGIKSADFTLPKGFSAEPNMELLSQAIHVYRDRSHVGLAKAKTRAEVNRTKKKLYKQKGTGGARHGARSAPIFVGGGAAHGPKPLKRQLSLPVKMKRRALEAALSLSAKSDKLFILGGVSGIKKTNDVKGFTNKVLGKGNKIIFALSEENHGITKFLRNIKNSKIVAYKDLNALDVFNSSVVVIDRDVFGKEKKSKKK